MGEAIYAFFQAIGFFVAAVANGATAVGVGGVRLLWTCILYVWDFSRPARAAVTAALTGAVRWVGSVKGDLLGERDVNPVITITKLLVLVAGCVLLGILVVGLFR
jgi:hypothetical protein